MTSSPSLRIGDAERDAAAERLGKHYVAGRLTQLEYDERLTAALSARTGADLDRLFADLPLLDEQRPAPRPYAGHRHRPGLPLVALGFLFLLMLAGAMSSGSSSSGSGPQDGGNGAASGAAVHSHVFVGVPHFLPVLFVLAALLLLRRRFIRRRR